MVTVHLDIKKDCFFAEFSNLGLSNVPITDDYPEKFDRLLCGGIWCIVQLEYEAEGDSNFGVVDSYGNPISSKQKKQKDISPISIRKLTPVQMPHTDIEEVREGRKAFTQDEWMDVLLRSIGMEPIQWDVDSLDWKDISASEISERVLKRVQPGSIVLFHNAAKHTPEALPGIIGSLLADGYTIVPISQILLTGEYTIDHTGRQCGSK